jgi:hypothetical protein
MSDQEHGGAGGANSTDTPRVFAVKRNGDIARLSKRSFLKTAAGAAAGVVAGCSDKDKKDDEPPGGGGFVAPFTVGGVTYSVMKLPDYNAALPPGARSAAIVGYVGSDFYFRAFNDRGEMVTNSHESRVADKASLAEMKELVTAAVKRGKVEAADQAKFAQVYGQVAGSASATPTASTSSSGRRLQGSRGGAAEGGRRLQGSAGSGRVSGRRMQGAEGRPEGDLAQRNLGTVAINGQRYTNTRVVETYTDGYTKVAHAAGDMVVRTDALPEIVRMQLSIAVPNPKPMPSAIPRETTVVTPAPAPAVTAPPVTQPIPSTPRTYTYHYWRPN